MTHDEYYGEAQTARREKFNRIINDINMVLMNNIPEVDESIWENWQGKSPMSGECDIEANDKDSDHYSADIDSAYYCNTHENYTDEEYSCEEYDDGEVYQWFAVGDNDADYLKRHNQYVTYSNKLDTYFLAITHFGTSWDYVDSMVDDILGDK